MAESRMAVIYDRASSIGQRDNWSREDAHRIGAELAERHGYLWELRQEIKSGETLESRPVMLGILQDVEAGKVGAIVVQDFTRLSRDEDGIDGRVIRNVLRSHDCKVITTQKVYDFTLDADDDMADFNFLIGKIHKRQTVTALVRGMKEKARQGQQIVGQTLLGYRRVYDPGDTPGKRPVGRLEVEGQEREIVKLIFDKYMELQSARATAAWLNDHGYQKPVKSKAMQERYSLQDARPFRGADISATLRNPLYAGWVSWGKTCTSRHMRDFEAEWHYRPELQIVSQDLWDRANAIRRHNGALPSRVVGSEYAFSMLLACPTCGGAMVGTSVVKSTGRHRKYRCEARNKAGSVACSKGDVIYESVIARAVIPLAADLISKGLDLGNALGEAARDMSSSLDDELENGWRAGLADVQREASNLARAIAKGTISEDQARAVSDELAEKKARLERNLSKLGESVRTRKALLEAIPAIMGDVEGVLWRLLEHQPKTLRQILGLIFAEKSIVVETWGPNSRRESRVASYQLSDAFSEVATLEVCMDQGSTLSLSESTLVAELFGLMRSAAGAGTMPFAL